MFGIPANNNECIGTVFFARNQCNRLLDQFFWETEMSSVHSLEVCRYRCPVLSRGPGESCGTLHQSACGLIISFTIRLDNLDNCPKDP